VAAGRVAERARAQFGQQRRVARQNAHVPVSRRNPHLGWPARAILTLYTRCRYDVSVAGRVEFDWDEANIRHLKTHGVSPGEFEQLIAGEPLDMEYQVENDEERHKSLGRTDAGRVVIAVWTVRHGRIRAITAYPANRRYQRLYWEYQR